MGYEREIGRAIFGLTLLIVAASATAEPPELLIVTQLGNPEAELEPTVSVGVSTADRDIETFGRAVSQAVRLQQQSIEERCRSQVRTSGKIGARWAWEASCRYQRH